MEPVRRYLHESEERVTKLEKDRKDMVCKIQLARTQDDINSMDQELEKDQYISCQCAQLDIASQKELTDFGKRIEKEQVAHLKKALSDQRAMFAHFIAKERDVAKEVLRQTREEHENNIKNERGKIDSLSNQVRTLLVEWNNERTKLKSLIENLTLTQKQEVHGNMNNEGPEEAMITMPRWYFSIAVDYYCHPDVVMKFFVHKVPKLYSDLLKYDLRARLGQFTIASPTTSIEYADVIDGLYCHGYIRDAEVYYLDPTPGSMPCTGLVKIIEAEDVKLMVSAHAQMGTKIAHLYLVSTYEDQSPHDEFSTYADLHQDDDAYLLELDEEAEEGETYNAMNIE